MDTSGSDINCTHVSYIYVRTHESYDQYNACKLGKANNIPERDMQYSTGEIVRGKFNPVFEVNANQVNRIERLLQSEFSAFNIRRSAGTEFYNKDIICKIEPYLKEKSIPYRVLTEKEVDNLVRKNRVRSTINKIKNAIHRNLAAIKKQTQSRNSSIGQSAETIIDKNTNVKIKRIAEVATNSYVPRPYQNFIIGKALIHFKKHSKGLLVLMCGVGKTLISLWITQKLSLQTILIGVPNTLLLKQWATVAASIFTDIPCLMVESGINADDIESFLTKNKHSNIVITTYSSAFKLHNASSRIKYVFGMKIQDEAHHLTCREELKEDDRKSFIKMLNIKATKQLSLTATLKLLEYNEDPNSDEIVISNDNVKYFGKQIDRKCLLWAIEEGVVCDYVIQTVIGDEDKRQFAEYADQFNLKSHTDRRLFLSAFTSLKSINDGHSHHLLIYANKKENSVKLINYIELLLNKKCFVMPDLYFAYYHSDIKQSTQKDIITRFQNTKVGIISCVYCLGEGWDFPLLDGVVFAENMTSNIRIVQSALRASRKNLAEPNKITKIILPILNQNNWLRSTTANDVENTTGNNSANGVPNAMANSEDDSDYRKVREVIYQMSQEDKIIEHKIKVVRISVCPQVANISLAGNTNANANANGKATLGEYDEELTRALKLKTVKRAALNITYEKAKKIIAAHNLTNKEDYYELCDVDNRLTKEPEIIYKGRFINWIDYLGIKQNYYDFDTCKSKIVEYIKQYPDLNKYRFDLIALRDKLVELDPQFPPKLIWKEYYKVNDLNQIIDIGEIEDDTDI